MAEAAIQRIQVWQDLSTVQVVVKLDQGRDIDLTWGCTCVSSLISVAKH